MAVAWTPRAAGPAARAGHRADFALRPGGFETRAREVTDFLRRASIVPTARKAAHIDLDAELNDLLRQAS